MHTSILAYFYARQCTLRVKMGIRQCILCQRSKLDIPVCQLIFIIFARHIIDTFVKITHDQPTINAPPSNILIAILVTFTAKNVKKIALFWHYLCQLSLKFQNSLKKHTRRLSQSHLLQTATNKIPTFEWNWYRCSYLVDNGRLSLLRFNHLTFFSTDWRMRRRFIVHEQGPNKEQKQTSATCRRNSTARYLHTITQSYRKLSRRPCRPNRHQQCPITLLSSRH